MKTKKRIYCIEGHWDYGSTEVEPSVEPILQAIQSMGYWEYARRDCAVASEMRYWLDEEWVRCKQGSILYLATHGDAGTISLSKHTEGDVTTDQIQQWNIDLENCLVHFGGCHGLSLPAGRIRSFLQNTGASAVSGYRTEGGWSDAARGEAPSLALELMFFSSIGERAIRLTDGRSAKPGLSALEKDLRRRFPDCKFRLQTRWD